MVFVDRFATRNTRRAGAGVNDAMAVFDQAPPPDGKEPEL